MSTFKWQLDRPLAVFDIEATGITPRADRIIDLVIIKLMPDGTRTTHRFLVHPEMPIPPESTEIHGIHDEDVADCPTFTQVAREVYDVLEGCDLAGFNSIRFDIPMLTEEFHRAGIEFGTENRRLIDAQRIFHQREPRNLTAALSFYCGEMHLGAHGAEADVLATIRVLEGQFEHYPDLPRDMSQLHEYCNQRDKNWVDATGRLRWANNEVVLNFGKRKGTSLRYIIENETSFVKWILRSDFPRDVKEIINNAFDGSWPTPPQKDNGNSGS